jgi:hypothetical protein
MTAVIAIRRSANRPQDQRSKSGVGELLNGSITFHSTRLGCDNSAAGGVGSGLEVMSLTLPFDRALEAEYNLTRGTARRQFSCRLRSGSNYK